MVKMLGKLGSGQVVFDRPNSHLHKDILGILEEALLKINLKDENYQEVELDLGRVMGRTDCVETNDSDQIVYAKRRGRKGYSRFVKNRKSEDSSKIVIVLKKAKEENCYLLVTAFIGSFPGPEPWDPNATMQSKKYWSSHALIWNSTEIDPKTETSLCPW